MTRSSYLQGGARGACLAGALGPYQVVSLRSILVVCDQCSQERGGHKQIGATFPMQTRWPASLSQLVA